MPNLYDLTDAAVPTQQAANPVDNTAAPVQDSVLDRIKNRLLGMNGEERYQTWPERLVREGLTAPGDVLAKTEPSTSESLIQPAMQTAALAGTGGLAGTGENAGAALGSAPFLRPALKYQGKIYKAPVGAVEHSDAIPAHLQDDFYKKAMSGEDINHYQFGFMNHKGQFLNREDALDYGIKEGLVDPSAGQYGVLTSTMLSDSSKPGMSIEAIKNAKLPEGYYDKVPMDMRLSRSGTEPSHPGYRWEVYDPTNNKVMRKDIMSSSGASKTRDNLDNKYGGYKYRSRMVRADNLTDKETQFLKDNEIQLPETNSKYNLVPVEGNPFASEGAP